MATYEEARKEYEHKMGSELGKIYHILWNECALVHIQWEEYVALFGKNPEQFDIMNSVAPGFFKSVQDAFWERTLLHLCRFADGAKVSGRRTLSLDALLTCSTCHAIPNLVHLVTRAKMKIKFAQDWRNRLLAHLDLEYAFERSANPLAPASRFDVREALSSIKEVLQSVEQHFTKSELNFSGASSNWGQHLLNELKLVTRLRNEREERLKGGTATPDDYDWSKWH